MPTTPPLPELLTLLLIEPIPCFRDKLLGIRVDLSKLLGIGVKFVPENGSAVLIKVKDRLRSDLNSKNIPHFSGQIGRYYELKAARQVQGGKKALAETNDTTTTSHPRKQNSRASKKIHTQTQH